jgi:hypothetical protein
MPYASRTEAALNETGVRSTEVVISERTVSIAVRAMLLKLLWNCMSTDSSCDQELRDEGISSKDLLRGCRVTTHCKVSQL